MKGGLSLTSNMQSYWTPCSVKDALAQNGIFAAVTFCLRATIDYDSVPARIVNVTHVISSHGSDFVNVDYSGSLTSGVAPAAKVRVLSEFAIPIEVVFTVLWLIELLRAIRSEGVSVVRLPAILLARAFFVFGLTWESYEFVVRVDYYRYCVAYLQFFDPADCREIQGLSIHCIVGLVDC